MRPSTHGRISSGLAAASLLLCCHAGLAADEELDSLFGEEADSTESGATAEPTPVPYAEVVELEAESTPAPSPGTRPRRSVIEEIVVTAQKREQRLVDVPLNVSSLSGESMRNVRMEQVRDVAGYLPNVDIKEQVPGAIPVISIRGVGLDDFSSTNSPAAGIYVDQVPLSSLALMSFDLYDMERIEVLKGPQGTLYGRNSTAGAFNLLTARAGPQREGFFKAGYGDYEAAELEGMFNLPLGDAFGLRFAGKLIRQDEGYWQSRFNADGTLADGSTPAVRPADLPTGAIAIGGGGAGLAELALPPAVFSINHQGQPVARDLGRRDIRLGRVRAGWEASDALSLDLKLEGLRQRSEMGQPESFGHACNAGSAPIDPDNCADGLSYQDTDRDPYLGDWADSFPYTIDQLGATLLADWDLGFAELAYVGGWITLERFFHIDVDAQPADQFNFLQADDVNQHSHELRLAGISDSVDWLGGLFWSTDTVIVDTEGRHQDLVDGLASHIDADQVTESAAAFVNLDWRLSAAWSLTGGLRYTWETRDYVGGTTWTVEIPNNVENTWTDSSISDTNWSWKLGVNYGLDDGLIYANVSKGTKSGGYFSGVTTNQAQLDPYLPEQLVAYEIGAKLQGPLTLNASIFHYDYRDVQVFMRSDDIPVQFIGNVDEASISGLDVDALWQPLDGLTLQGGVGVLDGELGSFIGPSGDPIPKGNKTANSPDLTLNALLRYEFPLFGALYMAVQGDAHYASEAFKEATNDPLIKQDAYWLYNARLSVLREDRAWDVSLWGRNLGDVEYVVQGLDIGAFDFGNRNYNAPRTFGVEFSTQF